MEFRINIESDNEAFTDNSEMEIARILREIANDVENGILKSTIRDSNGNTVGSIYCALPPK